MIKALIKLIKAYRFCISPFLGQCCRFEPSCSQYMEDALKKYGIIRGLYLGIRRLLKCHPFHKGGYDPISEESRFPLNKF